MLGSQACSLQVLQLYFDISEVQGGRFFTGLRADPAQSGDTVKSKCSGDLATCASVLRWDSDDSSFDASSPWLKPDFFTTNSQLCIVIDPATKGALLEGCTNPYPSLWQIKCTKGKLVCT